LDHEEDRTPWSLASLPSVVKIQPSNDSIQDG